MAGRVRLIFHCKLLLPSRNIKSFLLFYNFILLLRYNEFLKIEVYCASPILHRDS